MNPNHEALHTWNAAVSSIAAAFVTVLLLAPVPVEGATQSPHWRKGSCDACHVESQPAAGQASLKATPAEDVCGECHGKRGNPVCRHRSDITPGPERSADFGEPLQAAMDGGKVVCTTCHDMTPHCALDVKQRYRNMSFLRGGPFANDSDQCFGCHSKSGYRQRSPHMHISKGQIKEGHCVFCHGSVPRQNASGQWMPVGFAIEGPLSQLCSGCHAIGPHPSSSVSGKSGWIHMSVPSAEYLERMQRKVAADGGKLPLDPTTGEMTCVTCHNPHNKRLEGYPVSADKTKTKLRYENICGACHEK